MRLHLALALIPLCGSLHGTTLFTDLGTGSTVYDAFIGWTVDGSGATGSGDHSATQAHPFSLLGPGSFSISQIDLAVTNTGGAKTFSASIWTDVNGQPGSQVDAAFWSLSTNFASGTCCGLITISGISGVTLAGGQQYFLVLAPLDPADTSDNAWRLNTTGVMAHVVQSDDGGKTWFDIGNQTIGAFDIIGDASAVPEPGSFMLAGVALLGVAGLRRALS